MYPTLVAYIIIITVTLCAVFFRRRKSRTVGMIQGVALQMVTVIPIAIFQLTGFVWKSWSIEPLEALKVGGLSVLFDMAGWSVYSTFEWLVPKRQTWVFSNLPEYSMLWLMKVLFIAGVIAWRRERTNKTCDWFTFLILLLVFVDSWCSRDFPWWGS